MRRFWDLVTRPILLERRPRRVVEIGSQAGESTRLLLETCRELGAHADIVDPEPPQNLEEIKDLVDAHATYHQMLSLEALESLPAADVYLIDGDHNWYTVFHELEAIHRGVTEADAEAPLLVLHDVDWPYGRRDVYYDLESVPEQHRQETTKGGVAPDHAGVLRREGLNHHLFHAQREGGPKNGVRAAVEDFLREHPEYGWLSLPGYNGLGFLVPAADRERAYARKIAELCSANGPVLALLERVELDRMRACADIETLRTAVRDARRDLSESKRKADLRLGSEERRRRALEAEIEGLKATRGYRALEALRDLRRRFR